MIVIILSVLVLKPFYKYIFKESKEDDVIKLIQKTQQLIQRIDCQTIQPNIAKGRACSKVDE